MAVTSSTTAEVDLTPTAIRAVTSGADEAGGAPLSHFSWDDVAYGVGEGKKAKTILSGISGTVVGGEICAVIGPSGAGKTSLLNILAGRIRHKGAAQRVSGTILLDDQPISGAALRKRIAYVMQQDLLCPTQTPREALLFSAMLRLPRAVPLEEKRELVEKMLANLGLLDCADTFIGNELIRGISGGEKKRTSIGIELVMKPKLVFLDEPTSGLDSFAAHAVIKLLRNLAATGGCNVLCTIHQPSSEAFHAFNKVMLLGRGECPFMGAIDALSSALKEAKLGCPEEYNLADHAVYLIQANGADGLQQLSAALAPAHAHAEGKQRGSAAGRESSMMTAGALQPSAGFLRQTFELFKREAGVVLRNKPGLIASVVIPATLNLVFALIFLGVGKVGDADYDGMSHFGAVTMVAVGGMFGAAQPLLLRFPLDRGIFLREYATSTYGAAAYFISKTLVELPQVLLNAVVVYLVVYWIMAFNGNFFFFVLAFWLAGLAAASTALLVGCIATNPEVANQAGPVLFVPQILFAGFYIKTSQIPAWLSWAQYLCSLKYGMNLMLITEFGDSTTADWSPDQQAFAEQVIDANDIDPDRWWLYVLILVAIIAGFRILAIIALARRAASFF